MKLQLLVPQWKEDEKIIKNLLNSIETQQGVNLKEIGVIIMNDGSDVIIPDEFFEKYSFKIDYYLSEHKGVSAMRNQCLAAATADYVMFCDADDMFFNNFGINIILKKIKETAFDVFVPTFIEELYQNEEFSYVSHNKDMTFVHGKVYRRDFLIQNEIFWNENLFVHEDSYFNYLAYACVKEEKVIFSSENYYLWKWRDNSVCRTDNLFLMKTYDKLVLSVDSLIKELLRRGKLRKAAYVAISFIYGSYYDMNRAEWQQEENQEFVNIAIEKFKKFYREYNSMMELYTLDERKTILYSIKKDKMDQGILLEYFSFKDWTDRFKDEEKIVNLPTDNLIEKIKGLKGEIIFNTTEQWNSQLSVVGKKGCLYLYTDYKNENGYNIAGLKVGNGNSYLIDTPFKYSGYITEDEIKEWNSKNI